MNFIKTKKYSKEFINENLMGPNPLKMLEELSAKLELKPNMKILDLGCGKGLTSIFLAKEFGAKVFATDLWIEAEENYNIIKELHLEDLIIPIHADANDLPFAKGYFDAIISVDAYYYFGRTKEFMDEKLSPFVKENGLIALAFPGFKKDIHKNLPKEFLLSWNAEDLETFHSCLWWKNLLSFSKSIFVDEISEMSCHDECWNDWLNSDIDYAVNDRKSMNAGAGKYMNLIQIIAHKK